MLDTPVRAGLSSPGAASIATPVVCFQKIGSNGGMSGMALSGREPKVCKGPFVSVTCPGICAN
jgi:hypothetical protein